MSKKVVISEEQKKEIIGHLKKNMTQDQVDQLKEIAQEEEVEFKKKKEEFVDVLASGVLDAIPWEDGERTGQALAIIKARLFDKMTIPYDDYEGRVYLVSEPKEIKTKRNGKDHTFTVGNVFGAFRMVDPEGKKGEWGCLNVSFYDDAAELVGKFTEGKTYHFSAGKGKGGLSVNEDIKVKEIEVDAPVAVEFLPEIYSMIEIPEVPFNISENKTDLKLVRGRVRSARVILTRNGGSMGMFRIHNDKATIKQMRENRKEHELSVRCDASLIRYGQGSDVLVLGTIDKSDQYGIGMWAQTVVAIIGLPVAEENLTPTPKQTTEQPKESSEDVEDFDGF